MEVLCPGIRKLHTANLHLTVLILKTENAMVTITIIIVRSNITPTVQVTMARRTKMNERHRPQYCYYCNWSFPRRYMMNNKTSFISILDIIVVTMAACGAFAAAPRHVSNMPDSPYLDTEVSTNIVLKSSQNELRKIGVDMEFVGTPTNNVQIAFGHDADGDGDLADEEAQLTFGWKSGRRFLSLPFEEYRIADEVAAQQAGSHRLHVVAQFNGMQRPVSFSLRDNASACLTNFVAQAHDWSGVGLWNICKVTRRGVNEAFEQVDVDAVSDYFVIKIR